MKRLAGTGIPFTFVPLVFVILVCLAGEIAFDKITEHTLMLNGSIPQTLCRMVAPGVFLFASGLMHARPINLRCEHLRDPLGIDAEKPSFSWQSDSQERNWRQTAYEILVASTSDLLKSGKADVWDSGKQSSGESSSVAYAGQKLESRKRYFWDVRVWDAKGRASQAAAGAWWEMGLLQESDWKAKWIRWQNPEEAEDRSGIRWIWPTGQDALQLAPGTEAFFHLDVEMPELPERAALFLIARGDWKVTVNGHDAGAKPHWNEFDRREIDSFLIKGQNSIDVTVTVPKPPQFGPRAAAQNTGLPGALAALLKIRREGGTVERTPSSERWQARSQADAQWLPANIVGELNDPKLGGDPGALPQPAALLRKQFSLQRQVASARLCDCAWRLRAVDQWPARRTRYPCTRLHGVR